MSVTGREKPAAKAPEKSLVRTAVAKPIGDVRADSEASHWKGTSV